MSMSGICNAIYSAASLRWHCRADFSVHNRQMRCLVVPVTKAQNIKTRNPQFMSATDWLVGWTTKVTDRGAWPGSSMSWGSSRVWLEPAKETNTYGRDNFSIHGGWAPGSAGCIDMTSNIKNFVALFEFVGKDLIVEVKLKY